MDVRSILLFYYHLAFTAIVGIFTGSEGRNHSSVANQGVADKVIPWLVEVEKERGDLRPN